MESYTGRSMDPLLPVGEPGRKKVQDSDYDVTQRHRSERHRSHVCSLSCTLLPRASLCDCIVSLHVFFDNHIYFLSRNGMKSGIENPVWPCGRLVWQHRTLQSRTGITSQRSSSLNPAPTKPMYVFASLVHKCCCLCWICVSKYISVFYSLYSTSVLCSLRICEVLNPPRMLVPKCGYDLL